MTWIVLKENMFSAFVLNLCLYASQHVNAVQSGTWRLWLDHVWHRHCVGPPHLPVIAFTAAQRPICT